MRNDRLPAEKGTMLDLIPPLDMLPGEDTIAFEDLRTAFLADLAPASPYQVAIAENIVRLEWEAYRTRKMRDSLLRTSFLELATGAFHQGSISRARMASDEAVESAIALVEQTGASYKNALAALSEFGIDESAILAKAYADSMKQIAPLEQKLSDIETRRRRLREDLFSLQRRDQQNCIDAEVLDGDQ